jgi:dTDP-4-amino-4,6-dideoxygalactose transaminase
MAIYPPKKQAVSAAFIIPFNKPFMAGEELAYISQVCSGGCLAGNGDFTQRCSRWLEQEFDAKKVLLTTSCTAALEMAAILADIRPGDEVIMPAFTFVSTANAFLLRGAVIKFVDIRSDTLNIDEKKIEKAITAKTKVIVPVHYAGVACEMDVIMAIAEKYGLLVIEDAAQGVKAAYKGKALGTIGHLGAYSFHETKNFISGEGGALVVTEDRFLERADILWEKGTNRSRFLRNEITEYTWLDIGSSYLPSEITAAFLYAQLEKADFITRKRWSVFNYYRQQLEELEQQDFLRLPVCPAGCTHNGQMFYMITQSADIRDDLLKYLQGNNVQAVFHYVPLHTSPMGRSMGYCDGDLPVTEDLSRRLIRLPCYCDLTFAQQDWVVACLSDFFHHEQR